MEQPGPAMPPRASVNSLINEDSLPEWLRNAANSGALPPMTSHSGTPQGTGSLVGNWESPPPAFGQPPAPLGSQSMYGQPPVARPQMPPSPVGSGSLGANHLFDESALPDWLRNGALGQSPDLTVQPSQSPYVPTGQYSPFSPYDPSGNEEPRGSTASAFPGIEQAGSFLRAPVSPETGMPASSLIDSNALPPWLSGKSENAALSAYGRDAARGLPASSLVDENALPPWLRNEHPAQPNSNSPSVSNATTAWNGLQTANQSMPAWLSQGYSEPQPPTVESGFDQASAWNSRSASGSFRQSSVASTGHLPGTIPAGEFVDESALPEWLRSQGGASETAGNPARNLEQASSLAGGSATSTFSASDLIDPSALPDWVRGTDEGPSAAFSSTSGWTVRQPTPPAPGTAGQEFFRASTNQLPRANGSFSTGSADPPRSSTIPASELPPWLSNGSSTPAARAGSPAPQRDTGFGWPAGTGDVNAMNNAVNNAYSSDVRHGGRNVAPYEAYDTSYQGYPAYGNNGGADEYDGFDEYDPQAAYDDSYAAEQQSSQPERRGWRRFFGRK